MFDFQEVLEELKTWWVSETDDFRQLVIDILASLPGGEDLDLISSSDEPLMIGWKEAELLGKTLLAIQEASDVKAIADAIFALEAERRR